ncbi:uncharacterized protein BDZ83DRAFT_729440 [Colletotrichum acutatum]|uniref:Uncharacterized protein n=1 Tax=Glomerella acutata TaxID=27357 RepID=A0AAD8USZ2_GLOAC|nr:uncharacterized protein BDZ83DRAFT_729440 [Colletotrichum acutatum]KAK1726564.1 hypothetical protein BDZ83DRAFT_729440 [Colletotrichum acutatum]
MDRPEQLQKTLTGLGVIQLLAIDVVANLPDRSNDVVSTWPAPDFSHRGYGVRVGAVDKRQCPLLPVVPQTGYPNTSQESFCSLAPSHPSLKSSASYKPPPWCARSFPPPLLTACFVQDHGDRGVDSGPHRHCLQTANLRTGRSCPGLLQFFQVLALHVTSLPRLTKSSERRLCSPCVFRISGSVPHISLSVAARCLHSRERTE